jgi:hypothetical protein
MEWSRPPRRFGFTNLDDPSTIMTIHDPDIYSR